MDNFKNYKVLRFFEEISHIPRNSFKEEKIKEYLINFAKVRGLKFYEDKFNNVIIYKKTCSKEPIILQAHTDMVCVKKAFSNFNFDTDGIVLQKKGDFLSAKETSLGADDGIGVALILEILDSINDCNIEAVFTASEETNMQGAYNLDVKKLIGKNMICLDGFDENIIVTSSASFTDFLVDFGTEKAFIDNTKDLKTFKLNISGLEGGHSGLDIDKNRGNSIKLIFDLISLIEDSTINDAFGGKNFNIIPSKAEVVFTTKQSEKSIKNIIKDFYKSNKNKFKNLKLYCKRQINKTLVLSQSSNLISFIKNFEQGVLEKEENMIIASQNISEIDSEQGTIKIGIRSNNKNYEKDMILKLKEYCKKYGFNGKVIDTQPSFNTLNNSKLLKNLLETNKSAKQIKNHFAVECGILQERIKNLDVVIISPTILNAHSTEEKVNINSVLSTYNWLVNFLNLKNNF